jgi:predicted murein hydrolase (TIGR00659 family)
MRFNSDAITAFTGEPVFGFAATLFAYVLGVRLYRCSGGNPLLHPTFVGITVIAVALKQSNVPYEAYMSGAGFVHFLLGPAVVLLAVPLFRHTAVIRSSGWPVAVGLGVGLPIGIGSAVGFGWVLGAKPETLISLAPKSVTTGIAIGVSESIGGIPPLTAVLVIMTGIVGGVLGPAAAGLIGVRDPRAVGLAMGIASHGIGTARAFQIGEVAGTFSSLGMGLNGVLTAMLVPLFLTLL